MRGDVFGPDATVYVVFAAGAESFHQRLVAAFAHGDDRECARS